MTERKPIEQTEHLEGLPKNLTSWKPRGGMIDCDLFSVGDPTAGKES